MICARCDQPIKLGQLYQQATRATDNYSEDQRHWTAATDLFIAVHVYPCPVDSGATAYRNGVLGPYTAPEIYETLTPTSQLLTAAAKLIHDLMLGKGVDQLNGWHWEPLVRQLHDRAAAFKACEDEGK